jgi:hypothetical protein
VYIDIGKELVNKYILKLYKKSVSKEEFNESFSQ